MPLKKYLVEYITLIYINILKSSFWEITLSVLTLTVMGISLEYNMVAIILFYNYKN